MKWSTHCDKYAMFTKLKKNNNNKNSTKRFKAKLNKIATTTIKS